MYPEYRVSHPGRRININAKVQTSNMSFTKLMYDPCAYSHKLSESIGACDYVLDPTFAENTQKCYVPSSSIRVQRYGVAPCDDHERVDVDSELRLGLGRKLSKCPAEQQVKTPPGERICSLTLPSRECNGLDPEHSRLSHPACALRSTPVDGFDRWQSVLLPCVADLQSKFEMPFANNVSYRLIAKDTHRACVLSNASSPKCPSRATS